MSYEIHKECFDPESQFYVEPLLISQLEGISAKIFDLGYPSRPYSRKSLQIYALMSATKKIEFKRQLDSMVKLLNVYNPDKNAAYDIHPEESAIDLALKFFGLEMRDDFWKVVSQNDILEIYNIDQIQIFRTLNFFKITGYSLLDMLTIEWFELWHRSSLVLQNFMKFSNDVYQSKLGPGVHPVNLPEHVVKEIYNTYELTEFSERIALAKFKFMCPLYAPGSSAVQGVILSSQGRLLALGQESQALSFI